MSNINYQQLTQNQGQMFDLDGTLTPSINFPKNPLLLGNFAKLKLGTLAYIPGADSFLRYLKQQDKKIALISNMPNRWFLKGYRNDAAINAAAPFDTTFDIIKITGLVGRKNKTDLMLETLDEWKLPNDQAIYYGDTLKDAVASHDAKVKFCLIGNPREKDLREIQKISKLHMASFPALAETAQQR